MPSARAGVLQVEDQYKRIDGGRTCNFEDTDNDDDDEDFEEQLARIIYDDFGWENEDYFIPEDIQEDAPPIGNDNCNPEKVGDCDRRELVLRSRSILVHRRIPLLRGIPVQRINPVEVNDGDRLSSASASNKVTQPVPRSPGHKVGMSGDFVQHGKLIVKKDDMNKDGSGEHFFPVTKDQIQFSVSHARYSKGTESSCY